jgi:DNA polymerase II small subunit/DNA polymerase delta subunit B
MHRRLSGLDLMSEQMRKTVGQILEAGFQVESDAFKTLIEIGKEDRLGSLVEEVLRVAGTIDPRPVSINRDLVLKAATQLEIAKETIPETGLGRGRRFAEDVEARLEVVSDPTGKLGTTGAFDDFLKYFRNRFEKMSGFFRARMDTRSAGTVADGKAGGQNGHARFVCMVVEKREKPG